VLVNLCDVLPPAAKGKYAVGLFNTINLEMARGVLAAAEKTRSPVIIGTAEALLPFTPLEELACLLLPMAKKATVPVVVHFDHGLSFETCMTALQIGFTSAMFDCSHDNLAENARKVRELSRAAHAFGASVEAELGHVGNVENSLEGTAGAAENPETDYTDPGEAKAFVLATMVDALAVAVGTAHGLYTQKPKLDFDRIGAIASLTKAPLVLHGGSGLTDDDFRRAIAQGISKINIFSDINVALAEGAAEALRAGHSVGTEVMLSQMDAIQKAAEKKMLLFGCCGKA
jgi:fructose-bisphosphate aldolase class II